MIDTISLDLNLTHLANKYKSDKGTIHGGPPHKYTYLYDLIFSPYKNRKFNFLEMGLAAGGPEVGGPIDRQIDSPSIQMWLEYFPNAMIYGFDITDFSSMKNRRFSFTRGDSGSASDLKRLSQTASHFDIILDDASHASYHQQLALKALWDKLSPQGIYIIEDLQWQSPFFEDKLPEVPKTAELLISLFEKDATTPSACLSTEFLEQLRRQCYSFSAFSSIDGQVNTTKQIILKKR